MLRRVPLSHGAPGRVAATAQPVVSGSVNQPELLEEWSAFPEVQGLDAQPIGYKGEVLGVLLLLTRIPTPPQSPIWVRIFADHLGAVIMNARSFDEIEALKTRLELENSYLREEIRESKTHGGLIGLSLPVKRLLQQVEMVARTDATVLVCGESGTGKELVAREIHRRSRRSARPLIQVNCASIPRDLFESEFFGHVKGAFTGALRDRAGRFEAANGGTLFLDEVGEIPLELQSKLLRVLQEKRYERVGEEQTRTVDVRIVAATNRDLKKAVLSGQFRQDLFYRLNVFPIQVAPLRERREDVPLLAGRFLAESARKLGLPAQALSPEQERQLREYEWPGNVRELQNVVERALILAQTGPLSFDLPGARPGGEWSAPGAGAAAAAGPVLSDSEFRERERVNVLAALEKARWKIHGPGGAAELLGIKPTTLISRAKKLGLAKPPKAS
jgi:transcriptional regulator with GAF, ATPase, and Fis domain